MRELLGICAGVVQPGHLAVVSPVFNDWQSFYVLLQELDGIAVADHLKLTVLAIDDGSSQMVDPNHTVFSSLRAIGNIEVVRLACNMGHQRAIATGLVLASEKREYDAAIVMDADGEDSPADLPRLLELWRKTPDRIICAERRKRSEGSVFRVLYWLYKLLFRSLTGTTITFGNYCILPAHALRALVHNPGIWNHLAASIIRSRIPYTTLSVDRAQRYAGDSKMNLVSLVVHGLSAVALYSDTALVRLLLAMGVLMAVALLSLCAVIAIRLLTDAAIPGWASAVGLSLLVILVQSIVFSVIVTFLLLSGRSTPAVVPAFEARKFVLSHTVVVSEHV